MRAQSGDMALAAEQSETWLRLSEATVLIDHDHRKARQRLERAVSKAWLVRPPGLPQPPLDPNIPLRIQVTPPPGLRIDGRAWLDNPVLDWDASEVECLCKPWTPAGKAPSSRAETQCRASAIVEPTTLFCLWSGNNSASHEDNHTETTDERGEIYGY